MAKDAAGGGGIAPGRLGGGGGIGRGGRPDGEISCAGLPNVGGSGGRGTGVPCAGGVGAEDATKGRGAAGACT